MALIHSPKIVTDNLLLYLDAGNTKSYTGSGTAWTDIIGGYNGTLVNTPTFSSDNVGYFEFNGTNEYVDLGEDSDFGLGTDPFSVEMWFYRNGTQSQHSSLLSLTKNVSGGHIQDSNFQFVCNDNSSFKITMYLRNASSTGVTHQFNTVIPDLTWTHVVYVKEGTGANQVKCYVNGVVESSTFQIDFTLTNSNPRIYVAANRGNNYYHKGKISQCRIYKGKGLTAAEVKQNFDATKRRYQ